jgi:hypothetical protein
MSGTAGCKQAATTHPGCILYKLCHSDKMGSLSALGIKANGASELLAPDHLATHLTYDRRRLSSVEDDNLKFKSLSPLVFRDITGLKDVLGDHMNGKNGKPAKANKTYEGYNVSLVSKESLRYHYENLRCPCFYHLNL